MAGLTQFISVKLMQQQQTTTIDPDNPMARSMNSMNYIMPLFSVFMGFTLPAGLGLYWAISAIVRCVQQMAINKYLSKKSVDDIGATAIISLFHSGFHPGNLQHFIKFIFIAPWHTYSCHFFPGYRHAGGSRRNRRYPLR